MICRDPGIPLEQPGGVISDVASAPGFYEHYRSIGESFPVAEHVLRRFFAAGPAHAG